MGRVKSPLKGAAKKLTAVEVSRQTFWKRNSRTSDQEIFNSKRFFQQIRVAFVEETKHILD